MVQFSSLLIEWVLQLVFFCLDVPHIPGQFGLVFVNMDQMKVKRLEETSLTSITIDQIILGFNKIIAISSSQVLHP